MLISFEGIDGCGKTTQIKLLAKYLNDCGKSVEVFREPGGTEFAESIREILLKSKMEITPASELLLFNAARADLVTKVIKPLLAQETIVILDRFYDSTTAYQGYGRGISLDFIRACNEFATQSLSTDITFFLDIPYQKSKERSAGKSPDRIESCGEDFYGKVIEGFRTIAKANPERIKIIDGSVTIEQVFDLIKETTHKYIK